jgi:isopentenyl diphosphate isomerase/L-lactate dehydrogenase-like FMN-dependent dehydrogenase
VYEKLNKVLNHFILNKKFVIKKFQVKTMYGGASGSREDRRKPPAKNDKRASTTRNSDAVPKRKPYEMKQSQSTNQFVPPPRDELLNAPITAMRRRGKPVDADQLLNVQDYQNLARSQLNRSTYEHFANGSDDQITLAENQAYYAKIKLLPRVFVDVSHIDTKISLLNGSQAINFPVMIAPISSQNLLNPDGEKATARAAASLGTIMCTSTLSATRLEQIVSQPDVSNALWYQLYILRDRQFTKQLIQKVESAGYKALVVTVDAPLPGNRESEHRNKSNLPEGVTLGNLLQDLKNLEFEKDNDMQIDASLTWDDLDWLHSITKLPILVKGILTPYDALLALKKGCSGIIISNHGARQIDTAISTIEALPAIVKALRMATNTQDLPIDVYVDGGIRRGTDVLKALCLGAKAVFVGRPIAWGLAANGEQGVKDVLSILKKEFELACMLCGITSITDCNESFVLLPGQLLLDRVTQELRSKL